MISALAFSCLHYYHSPFELTGRVDPILVASLILPCFVAGLLLGYCYIKHGRWGAKRGYWNDNRGHILNEEDTLKQSFTHTFKTHNHTN